MTKIFVSATSHDLKSYRQIVADWGRDRGLEVVIQDEFPVMSDYGTIVQILREKLDPCDAVIHLVGLHYGFEPTNRPDGATRRSYTQLEYELGKEQRRQVFRLIACADYKPDQPTSQSDELASLQLQHRQRLMQGCEAWSDTSRTTGNELYYEFSTHEELRALLEAIEIKSTLTKPDNLKAFGSLFKGRDGFIEQLRTALEKKPTHIAAVMAKQAIHGLGGVGKTRVAVEYGRRYSHEYTALLFVSGDSPEIFQQNLANLCGALVLDLPEKDAREQEVQAAAAIRWLREHSGWFLIVDNVDTPEAAESIESLLAKLHTGHVVITSRLSQWGDAVESLALDVISETDARDLVLERTEGRRKPTETDNADALALANDLGGLPLALEQAGAFIAKHRGSLQEYRTRWKAQEAKVLTWHDQRTMKYPASVATTWKTSVDRLSNDGRGLLNVLCWLAPDPMPLSMLQKLSANEEEAEIDVESGIADLAEYSLCEWTGTEFDAIEIHRLVQEITRFRLPAEERKTWLERALRTVDDFIPTEPDCYDARSWPTIYVPAQNHIAAIVKLADENAIIEPTGGLMMALAGFLCGRCEFGIAEPLMRRALSIGGAEHPNVAIRLASLASLLQATNRLDEAEPLMRRALSIDESSYGAEHPNVANCLGILASLLQETNRLDEAEPLIWRGLSITESSFGTDHPKVAPFLGNLAHLFQATNRLEEAEPLMRRALSIDESSYGTEHPRVALRLRNLAGLLGKTNRVEEAEPLLRRALSIDESSYGADHPNVAGCLNNLAALLMETNRLEEAEPMLRRALSINESSYGADHPKVAGCLNNLSRLLQAMNRLTEAETHACRALSIEESSYGADHPNVAISLNTLAYLFQTTNRLEEAEPLMRRALSIDESSYGADHPSVAISLNTLAQLLQAMNRLEEAETLAWRALKISLALGPEHPDSQRSFLSYLSLLSTMGLSEDEAFAKVLSRQKGDM